MDDIGIIPRFTGELVTTFGYPPFFNCGQDGHQLLVTILIKKVTSLIKSNNLPGDYSMNTWNSRSISESITARLNPRFSHAAKSHCRTLEVRLGFWKFGSLLHDCRSPTALLSSRLVGWDPAEFIRIKGEASSQLSTVRYQKAKMNHSKCH